MLSNDLKFQEREVLGIHSYFQITNAFMRWLLRLVAAHDTTAQAICPLLQHLPLHCDNVIASKSTNLSTCQLAFVKRSRKRTNVNGWSYVRGQVPCKREMSVTSRKNSRISTAASSDSLCELVVLAIQLPHGNALHKGKVKWCLVISSSIRFICICTLHQGLQTLSHI